MAVDFGSVAKPYALLEKAVFGDALQRARLAHLDLLAKAEPASFLLAGEGDGRFLQQLAKSHPAAEFTVIDSSTRMLALTRQRLLRSPRPLRVKFVHGDILAPDNYPDTPPEYGAVISHFFLDCFSEPEIATIAEKIARRLAPGGLWIVTDFQRKRPDVTRSRRIYESVLLRTMYLFFKFTADLRTHKLPNYEPALMSAGFSPLARSEFLNGFVTSTAFQRFP